MESTVSCQVHGTPCRGYHGVPFVCELGSQFWQYRSSFLPSLYGMCCGHKTRRLSSSRSLRKKKSLGASCSRQFIENSKTACCRSSCSEWTGSLCRHFGSYQSKYKYMLLWTRGQLESFSIFCFVCCVQALMLCTQSFRHVHLLRERNI